MLVKPTTARKKTDNGEQLVDVYDITLLNRSGGYTRVAYAIPEAVIKMEWEDYLKRVKN